MKTNKKNKIKPIALSRFLFRSIIFIVVLVFAVNMFISFVSERYGSAIFSKVANYYSADYVFENYEKNKEENIGRIESVGGWIDLLNENLQVEFSTRKNKIPQYSMDDILSLSDGKYILGDENYYGSLKKLDSSTSIKYGLVVLPKKIVEERVSVVPNQKDTQPLIYFFIFRSLLFFIGCIAVTLIASKILNSRLLKPLERLGKGFEELENEKYWTRLGENTIEDSIHEFIQIKESFNSMAKTLEMTNKEKKEQEQKRRQLLRDIRHDLKTPVTVIKGFSKAILNDKVEGEDIKKYISLINKNASSIDRLISELSDIVEFERSNYKLQAEQVDFYEFLRQSIIDFIPIFEEHDIAFDIDIPENRYLCFIDTKIFVRVLKNLMWNIVAHNPKGIEAFFKAHTSQEHLILEIGDTGALISDELAENLFDLFVTGDQSRNTSAHNSGIGLSIAKRIVELHGGEIYLDRNREEYSKVFVIKISHESIKK